MIQRCLAKRTRSRSFVWAGSVDNQYLIGSASDFGHSISSHSSAWGARPQLSRFAGRMRTAAKRERKGLRVPSRQLTVFQTESDKLTANSRTLTGWRRTKVGGR